MPLIFIVILATLLFLYLALPLTLPGQSDLLPDLRDPVTQDLEEERDALLRAIRELDARDDLPAARRDALSGRYEAKTAKVLRALDERQEQVPPPATPKRRPLLPLTTADAARGGARGCGFMATSAVPEVVAKGGTTPSISGRELAGLERAAERDPGEANLLALADGCWRAQSGDRAEAVYQRVLNETTPVPAVAYKRLGMLQLQTDVGAALPRAG